MPYSSPTDREQERDRACWGEAWNGGGLVFTREDGSTPRPEHMTRHFQNLAAAAGLPVIRCTTCGTRTRALHSLPACLLKIVSERLGHSQTAITADLYSHVNYGVGRAAARQIAAILRPTNSEVDAVPSDFLGQRPIEGSDGGTDEPADLSTSKGSADGAVVRGPTNQCHVRVRLEGFEPPTF